MPKLRHIAVTVPDLEEAASFYEKTFGMTRATESDIAILLTDGVVSLAILKFKTDLIMAKALEERQDLADGDSNDA